MEKFGTKRRLTEWEQIKENTNPDGDVLCIRCETAYLVHEIRDIKASEGYTEPKIVSLESFFCDVCDYYHLDSEESADIRKQLNK
jgi:hypothetical protein